MVSAVSNFISNFQDMFITKVNTVKDFPNNLSNIELKLISDQITDITNRLVQLSSITKEASEANLQEYKDVIRVLEEKLEYIENLSDMLLYINSFYDLTNVLDIKDYNLRQASNFSNILFDNTQKGLTLRSVSNTFNCAKDTSNGSSYVYYNTNSSYHTGIILDSPYLDFLRIKSIVLVRSDGLTLRLPLTEFNTNSHFIKHDLLSSTQITIEFNVNVNSLPQDVQEYYKGLSVSLVDHNYEKEGKVVLPVEEYAADRLFNFITTHDIPSECFMNNVIVMDLLDINKNRINTIETTLSVGTQSICKQLDNVNFDEVDKIIGVYINNKYKQNIRDKITPEYLNGLADRNEIYVIYKNRVKEEDKLNNYMTILNNQGFVLKNKNIKYIRVSVSLEMFSFNNKLSPTLKMMTGVTKL